MHWLMSLKKMSFCSMITTLSVLTFIFGLISMVILQSRTIDLLRSKCDVETLQPINGIHVHNSTVELKTNEVFSNIFTNHDKVGTTHAPIVKGVAFTIFLGSPKWFQNRYSMMINLVHGALPKDWIIQIFYLPKNKMSAEAVSHPGIQKQIKKGNVILVPIPDGYAKLRKRELMLLPWLWKQLRAEQVLTFGGTNVLCSNSPLQLDLDFGKFDYVGSPSPDFNGIGGDGGLSFRNRTAILNVLRTIESSGNEESTVVLKSMLKNPSPYVIGNKADTFAFALNDGSQSFNIDWNPENVLKFPHGALPLGMQGTLAGLSDVQRSKALDYCPELKMFFPSLHSGACFGASPRPLECFKFLCENGGLRCDEDAALESGIEYEVNKKSNPGVKGKLSIKIST